MVPRWLLAVDLIWFVTGALTAGEEVFIPGFDQAGTAVFAGVGAAADGSVFDASYILPPGVEQEYQTKALASVLIY